MKRRIVDLKVYDAGDDGIALNVGHDPPTRLELDEDTALTLADQLTYIVERRRKARGET